MTSNRKQLTNELRTTADQIEEAANRAFTLEDEQSRRGEASQLRVVALGVSLHMRDAVAIGEAYLTAGRLSVKAHQLTDDDHVHASRSSRRDLSTVPAKSAQDGSANDGERDEQRQHEHESAAGEDEHEEQDGRRGIVEHAASVSGVQS